jgi:hypothetical protein
MIHSIPKILLMNIKNYPDLKNRSKNLMNLSRGWKVL